VISIVVITYNQERFIEELLNSIRKQTFPDIELIISDDASSDGTQIVIENWLSKYEDRFRRVVFLKNSENVGGVANLNRAMNYAMGELIKPMDGDDVLFPTALEYAWRAYEEGFHWLQGRVIPFYRVDGNYCFKLFRPYPWDIKKFTYDSSKFLLELLRYNFIANPGVFFSSELWEKYGPYDETYKFLADYPLWIKMAKSGEKIRYIPRILVYWRRHEKAVSFNSTGKLYSSRILSDSLRNTTDILSFENIPILLRYRLWVKKKLLQSNIHENRFEYMLYKFLKYFDVYSWANLPHRLVNEWFVERRLCNERHSSGRR